MMKLKVQIFVDCSVNKFLLRLRCIFEVRQLRVNDLLGTIRMKFDDFGLII